MKVTQLVIISILVVTLLIPMTNAAIEISEITISHVLSSTPPNYGAVRFDITATKPAGQNESIRVPVIVNGTTLSNIDVTMKANEVSKKVASNTTFPGASILMTNPFATFRPIPNNVIYAKSQNPHLNPVSSIEYDVKVGGSPTERVTVLVYADWNLWAIILDIVAVAITVFFVRRMMKA